MVFSTRFKRRRGDLHPALHPYMRFLRFAVFAAISIAGILVFAYFFRVPLRDDLVKQLLVEASKQGFRVEYDAVWGDLFGDVNFKNLKVIQDEDHRLSADMVNLSYGLIPLLFEQRFEIRSVKLVRPRVRWLLPEVPPDSAQVFDPGFNLDLYNLSIRSGRVELADTLIVENIQISTKLQVRPHKVEGRLRNANLVVLLNGKERLRVRQAKSNFSYSAPKELSLKGLLLNTDKSTIKGDLALGDSTWMLNLAETRIDLSEISPDLLSGKMILKGKIAEGKKGYGGDFLLKIDDVQTGEIKLSEATLTLKGKEGNFDFTMQGQGPSLGKLETAGKINASREALSGNIDIKNLELYDSSGLALKLSGNLAGNYSIEGKNLEGEFAIERAEIYPVSDTRIDFTGKLTGNYSFEEKQGGAKGNLDEIRFQNMPWGRSEMEFTFGKSFLNIKDFVLIHELSQLRASGYVSEDTISASFDIHSFPLGSLGKLNPLGTPADIDASLSLQGSLKNPLLSGTLLARSDESFFSSLEASCESFGPSNLSGNASVNLKGLKAPSGRSFSLSLDSRDGYLKAFAGDGKDMSLVTSGLLRVDWGNGTTEYECDNLVFVANEDSVSNRFPFVIGQAGDSLFLGPTFLFVGQGELAAAGSWRFKEMPRLELSLYDVNLATFGGLLGLPEGATGNLWGQVASRDEEGTRSVIIDLGASDVHLAGLDADSFNFSGTLDTSRLDFQMSLKRGEAISTASGYSYYNLRDSSLIGDFDVQASINDIGVWPFAFLKDIMPVRSGIVTGELSAKGRLPAPDITGWLKVQNAELYLPVMDITSQSADADIFFKNGKVIIDRLDATIIREKEKGLLQGRGDYALFAPGHPFYLGIICQNVPFSPDRHVFAVGSGNLTLKGTDTTPLWVKGNIDIKKGIITYGLGDEMRFTSPYTPPVNPNLPPPPPTYLDLTITGNNNIWLSNRDMQVEVIPNLDIKLRDDQYNPQITGTIGVKQGTFFWMGNSLKFDPTKSMIIFPPTAELNPELDLWASMKTDVIDSSGGYPQVITVYIHLSGTLYQPVPEFYSEPPVWTDSDIITYLNSHLVPGDLSEANYASAISEMLINMGAQQISPFLSDWIRLDIFRVENIGTKESSVTVGKYFGDRWFASYTFALSDPTAAQFKVEYEIGKNQDIVLERDENGANSLRWQFKYRF